MAQAQDEQIQFVGDNLLIPSKTQALLVAIAAVTGAAQHGPKLLKLHLDQLMQVAATSSVSITSLPMCPLGAPPEPIQSGFDSKGNLRLECLHSTPQHCWDLSGNTCKC
jgi:hypothetical protein